MVLLCWVGWLYGKGVDWCLIFFFYFLWVKFDYFFCGVLCGVLVLGEVCVC